MVRKASYRFEAEIRDTEEHYSTDDPTTDAQFTVVEDGLHPRAFDSFDTVSVYVADDHNETFTLDIESAPTADTTFADAVTESTGDTTSARRTHLSGPVGRLRIRFGAASAAPSSGSARVTIHALGQE